MKKFKLCKDAVCKENGQGKLTLVNFGEDSNDVIVLENLEKEIVQELMAGKSLEETEAELSKTYNFKGRSFKDFANDLITQLEGYRLIEVDGK